jgi:hypothetical protein
MGAGMPMEEDGLNVMYVYLSTKRRTQSQDDDE